MHPVEMISLSNKAIERKIINITSRKRYYLIGESTNKSFCQLGLVRN